MGYCPKARQLGETYNGKRGKHLGTVEGSDEKSAIAEAAKQFNITPARRNKIVVTRTRAAESTKSEMTISGRFISDDIFDRGALND